MRQAITPYLLYEDAGAAHEWLTRAFGFRETERIENEDGAADQPYGDRRYAAADLEGQHWFFAAPVDAAG